MRKLTIILFALAHFSACGPKIPSPEQDLPPLASDPFAGLEPIKADQAQAFTFRKGPAPPPSVSESLELPFPPPGKGTNVAAPQAGPLKVLRTQPTAKEGLIGAVTVSFDQPMVPVAALSQLKQEKVPLLLEPQPAGRFRWLGTRTVAFEPVGRMPFSTEYKARVVAGTRSAIGGVLAKEVSWTFSTPRPHMTQALPWRGGRQNKPDTAVALLFNQPVDGKALLAHLTLNKLTGKDFDLVPAERWAKLKYIGERVATWDKERALVLQPRAPLDLDTHYRLKLSAGIQGEGPLTSTSTQHHYFYTYSPLKVTRVRCGDHRCLPGQGFSVQLNNPLASADVAAYVKVTPEPKDLEVKGSGSYISIRGSFAARQKVTIEVLPGLVDVHDQKLLQGKTETLTTKDMYPVLAFPARGSAVLERRGGRKVPLQVVSVTSARMRLVKVRREQLLQVIKLANNSWDDNGRRDPLKGIKGLVKKRTLKTGVKINSRARLGIPTDECLGRGKAGVCYIELRSEELRRYSKWANPFLGLVVSVTDIGIMARYDHDKILVMATGLESGAPLAGVSLELRGGKGKVLWTGETGADGAATAPGRRQLKERPRYVLWAQKGADQTFAILDSSGAGGGYISSYSNYGYAPAKQRLKLFMFTDRDPYRPGERVHINGVVRQEDMSPEGGITTLPGSGLLKVVVTSPRGNKVLEQGKIKASPGGAFSLDYEIPEEAELGAYRVHVNTLGGSGYGTFQVQAYRAPEFAVKVEAGQGPHFLGDSLEAKVGADYLFGAPMSGAEASWTLRRSGANFRPPNNDGFTFGERLPWWFSWRYRRGMRGGRHGGFMQLMGSAGGIVKRGKGALDKTGRLALTLPLLPAGEGDKYGEAEKREPDEAPPQPASFTLEAQVVDQNRQSIANRQVITAHPAALYVGLRPARSVVKAGEPLSVAAVLAGLDGARVAGATVIISALQVKNTMTPKRTGTGWTYAWESKEVQVGTCQVTSAADPAACDLTLARPGAYLVRAEATDDKGRKNRTTLQVYAHGPGYVPWRLENQSKLELVADKESYSPGDVARVLIKSPLKQAVGFLTVSRGGMVSHRILKMTGNAQVVEVKIPANAMPEVHITAALSRGRLKGAKGDAARDLGRPTFAHGQVKLPVTIKSKQVTVDLTPDKEAVRPSGSFKLKLQTRDSQGEPVAADLAVMVVDEGVLSLLNYKTPDPLAFFWSSRGPQTGLQDTRNTLLKREVDLKSLPRPRYSGDNGGMVQRLMPQPSAAPARLSMSMVSSDEAAPEAPRGMKKGGQGAPAIRARALFATTAYFNPSVVTDSNGQAEVTIKMPDNLTTFRIMAVAMDRQQADRFGNGEAQVKVRKPLLLRPSLPRFLSVGDRFEAAVMVHNETDADSTVDVLVRGRNLRAMGPTREQVKIKAHQATEVRFPLQPLGPGPARIQFAAVMRAETDAVEKQIPVLLPATTEAFATYGVTDSSLVQPVTPPANALPGYGGLEISMSSTALTGLEDAVRYLVDYPHECTEQTASRLLPIFGLKQILTDFKIGGLADLEAQEKLARAGVRKLIANQRYDGGWGMWSGSRRSWPYLTAYALFTLRRAMESGHKVDKYRLDRTANFLKRRLDYPEKEFGEQYNYTTQVLSVWALSDMGRHEKEHLKRLYGLRHKVPLFAQAMLMQAIYRAEQTSPRVKEMLRELNNQAVETASAAHFAEVKTESLRLLMHSEDRTDAMVLYAVLEVDPAHSLIPKLARGLIQSRVKGRWSTTQANAYALTSLARYYKQVEKVIPDYAADLWLGEDGYLGRALFKGRQLRVVRQKVPLAALSQRGRQDLLFAKKGPGKLYYRIGLRYAPRDLVLPAEEQGFSVTRTFEPVEGATDTVTRDKEGAWVIKAGATVRVRLTLVVPDQRYFVALMDPLPAGLEGVNLAFATSASSRLGNQQGGRRYDFYSWYAMFAFNHREMRDESVVLFADRLPSGVYETTYLARATTLGRFVAAPTRAEEMYRPETFGRTSTDIVLVQ